MTGGSKLHICQKNVNGLYYRGDFIEPSFVSYPRLHRNEVTFRDDSVRAHRGRWPAKSPDLVSYWTFVGHPRETCPETASQAKGHQRARWCTPGGMAPDPPSNYWEAHQEHEASLYSVPCSEWSPTRYWDFCKIDVMTLTNLEVQVTWLIENFVVDDKCVV